MFFYYLWRQKISERWKSNLTFDVLILFKFLTFWSFNVLIILTNNFDVLIFRRSDFRRSDPLSKMQLMSIHCTVGFPENKGQKNKIFHQIFEENRRSNFSVVNVDVVQCSLRTTNQSATILKEKDENTFLTNRTIFRFVYENKLKIINSSFVQNQPIRLALRTMSYLTNANHVFKWIHVPRKISI